MPNCTFCQYVSIFVNKIDSFAFTVSFVRLFLTLSSRRFFSFLLCNFILLNAFYFIISHSLAFFTYFASIFFFFFGCCLSSFYDYILSNAFIEIFLLSSQFPSLTYFIFFLQGFDSLHIKLFSNCPVYLSFPFMLFSVFSFISCTFHFSHSSLSICFYFFIFLLPNLFLSFFSLYYFTFCQFAFHIFFL